MVAMVQLLNLVPLEEVITSPIPHHPGLQPALSALLLLSVKKSRHGREDYLTPSVYWLVSCRVCVCKLFYCGSKSRKHFFISPMRTLVLTVSSSSRSQRFRKSINCHLSGNKIRWRVLTVRDSVSGALSFLSSLQNCLHQDLKTPL